ncbi:MAG: ChaN family lipoprotein, partial [Verrucomicrobia bacterium]|nr:ChaN family lipoprotein [Verrucomicrobiota bacterium]
FIGITCITVSAQSAGFDSRFWRAVAASDIIYVGEVHDSQVDHAYELKLVRGMIDHGFRFAVGWEMFDCSQQELIESWQSSQISLDDLIKATGFQQHWGVYSPVYLTILELTQRYRIRNIALNAQPALTHKIARGEELSEKEKAFLPRGFAEPVGAFQNFITMMGLHPGLKSSNLRRFFAAQNVWDQTMASQIIEFLKKNPGTKLVILTGRGHVSRGFGVPSYVRQKTNSRQLILLPDSLFRHPGEQGSAALGSS